MSPRPHVVTAIARLAVENFPCDPVTVGRAVQESFPEVTSLEILQAATIASHLIRLDHPDAEAKSAAVMRKHGEYQSMRQPYLAGTARILCEMFSAPAEEVGRAIRSAFPDITEAEVRIGLEAATPLLALDPENWPALAAQKAAFEEARRNAKPGDGE